jgi:hypothetical protein
MKHPSGIPEKIAKKVVARRGRLHAFETLTPPSTALVVIDLDEATVSEDDAWQQLVGTVNRLAAAVRRTGGVVAWVLSRMDTMPKHFEAILGVELAARHVRDGQAGGRGTRLWHGLQREAADIHRGQVRSQCVLSGQVRSAAAACDPSYRHPFDRGRGDQYLLRVLGARRGGT